jgi:hypothetical protein
MAHLSQFNNTSNILFTFDYELFLGKRSGTIGNCLISPTLKLLNIFSKHNISGIFFVDVLWLTRLKDSTSISAKTDLQKIVIQLQKIIADGHYLFLHIHPHWLDADYIEQENQWMDLA